MSGGGELAILKAKIRDLQAECQKLHDEKMHLMTTVSELQKEIFSLRVPASPHSEEQSGEPTAQSVVLAAKDYAQRVVTATGQKFEIGELIDREAWFYAGARWARKNPNADVVGPQSSVMGEQNGER